VRVDSKEPNPGRSSDLGWPLTGVGSGQSAVPLLSLREMIFWT